MATTLRYHQEIVDVLKEIRNELCETRDQLIELRRLIEKQDTTGAYIKANGPQGQEATRPTNGPGIGL
jgi:hypothetical protein